MSKYKVPDLVRVIRGETISPVSLLLWAPFLVMEDVRRIPRALESLLAARCSPNLQGVPARAPLSIAVASNDQESAEDLLAYRADPNIASEGEERSALRYVIDVEADINVLSAPMAPPCGGMH